MASSLRVAWRGKDTLVTACHVLDREGITDGYGHVSVRVPGAVHSEPTVIELRLVRSPVTEACVLPWSLSVMVSGTL